MIRHIIGRAALKKGNCEIVLLRKPLCAIRQHSPEELIRLYPPPPQHTGKCPRQIREQSDEISSVKQCAQDRPVHDLPASAPEHRFRMKAMILQLYPLRQKRKHFALLHQHIEGQLILFLRRQQPQQLQQRRLRARPTEGINHE